MEKVYKSLQTEISIKGFTQMGNLQDMDNIIGQMEAISREISKMD